LSYKDFRRAKPIIQELLSNTTTLSFSEPIRVANFTPIEKAEASAFAQRVYDACFMDGGFTSEELSSHLEELGLWTQQDEDQHVVLCNHLQEMKVDYFDSFAIPSKRDRIKSAIDKKKVLIGESYNKKTYLSDYTCEAARDEAYGSYLFRDYPCPIASYIKFLNARIAEDSIRSLYFDHIWRMIWTTSKDTKTIFGLNANQLNDNQMSLMYWSKIYDNISESMEAPSSLAMRDSIAVDGWLIKQSKTREAEDRMKALPTNDASENFVMVSSAKEAREINSLNNAEGKQILKSRVRDLAANGELDERQFSHVKQEIGIRKNELSFRGNK
jgi:hypothetical protein